MYWPSAQDYNEAVQTPLSSFDNADLRNYIVETTPLGLPRCVSGSFASVYCFSNESRKVAVRCFLQNVPDQEHRYSRISEFVMHDDLPYTVPFEYIKKGIKVRGEWFPILKMHWVEGVTLTQFVEKNLQNGQALGLLASYFKQMTTEFHRAGIAHGDLQHDNILIADDEIRLVDYDGMFVPDLADSKASELGHRNYQHPKRDRDFFTPELDNFSSWIIYASLKSLAIDPSLWGRLQGGDDCLLLRQSDFSANSGSRRIQCLLQHKDDRVRKFAAGILHFLADLPQNVPPIDDEAIERAVLVVPETKVLMLVQDSVEIPREGDQEIFDWAANVPTPAKSIEGKILIPNNSVAIVPFPVGSTGWETQSKIFDFVSTHLQPNEKIIWNSYPRRDKRLVWNAVFALLIFLVGIPGLFLDFSFVIFSGVLVIGWVVVQQRLTDSFRMCVLTDRRVLLIKSLWIEMITFDCILKVEESAAGITVIVQGNTGIADRKVWLLELNATDTEEFLRTIPKTVAVRRMS